MDTSALENVATRANATGWIYGRRSGTRRQPATKHARSSARYMLPIGVMTHQSSVRLEDQILCALNTLGTATERQALELIARDRWALAHKAFTQMVASGAIVKASRTNRHLGQRRKIESQAIAVVRGTVLKKRVSSSVSASAYIRVEDQPKLVRVVAFGPLGHALWQAGEGSSIEVRGRWLSSGRRPYLRVYGFEEAFIHV